jgi:hypothetical protein
LFKKENKKTKPIEFRISRETIKEIRGDNTDGEGKVVGSSELNIRWFSNMVLLH